MAPLTTPPDAWWLCPNQPRCGHGAVLHDVDDYDDPIPRCCVDGCPCGAILGPPPPPDLAPDGCPTHDLAPGTLVTLDGAPASAGLVCQTWHDTRPTAAALRRLMHRALRWTPPHADIPPAWRR